jgi:hypothetical protein
MSPFQKALMQLAENNNVPVAEILRTCLAVIQAVYTLLPRYERDKFAKDLSSFVAELDSSRPNSIISVK